MFNGVIVRNEGLSVDFFQSPANNGHLVVTFTERTNRKVDGKGFGGEFLLGEGFDVIAVKTDRDVWYSNLDDSHIASIVGFLTRARGSYLTVSGYGSSMGAYGAIKLSRALSLDRVFGLSPVFDISQAFDQRWRQDISGLLDLQMMTSECITASCEYVFAFDPRNDDRHHISRYQEIIDETKLQLIRLPYSGHPSGLFLRQVGMISLVARTVLAGCALEKEVFFRSKRRIDSHIYLYWLADACLQHRKFAWALQINQRALERDSNHAETHRQRCRILFASGRRDEAIAMGRKVAEMEPGHQSFRNYLVIAAASQKCGES